MKCVVEGCENKRTSKGAYKTSCYCNRHRKTVRLESNKCSLCGWDGPCDFHRKVPSEFGGKYTLENIIVVCPNCHRLEHRKLGKDFVHPDSTQLELGLFLS